MSISRSKKSFTLTPNAKYDPSSAKSNRILAVPGSLPRSSRYRVVKRQRWMGSA